MRPQRIMLRITLPSGTQNPRPWADALSHSTRRAVIGSIDAARRAGIIAAIHAATASAATVCTYGNI
jgi:hypothetical protein